MLKQSKKAFTLVELIVVITILAILGTIAFISLQGYSKTARDSTRISDLSTMKTGLELFNLDAGKYPLPTDSFTVTYSGTEVWTQGTFGTATASNVDKLDKIPTDPLTDKEYTYSVTKTKQEFQLAGMFETTDLVLNTTLTQTNAGDTIATALVTGNYNGALIKTTTGTTCEILSLPSIISSETTTDLSTILTNEGLVYNGFNNLPNNYISSKYKSDGGFAFTSNQLVVHSDTESCTPLYDADDNSARTELITNLQIAYTGTIIANKDYINNITTLDISNPESVDIFGSAIITNSLGGDIITITTDGGEEIQTIYPGCDESDITVGGITIAACNVGTNTSGTGVLSYGEYFQFGRNCSYESNSVDCWTNGSNLILQDWENTDWVDGIDDGSANYWGVYEANKADTTFLNPLGSTDIGLMQGPCETGYHIPTNKEWNDLYGAGGRTSGEGSRFSNDLKIPMAGRRTWNTGNFGTDQGNRGRYWSSSPNGVNGYYVYLSSVTITSTGSYTRAYGFTIRCFKN